MKMIETNSENSVGLLAHGTSGVWDVSVDESLADPDAHTIEIESPNTYCTFRLRNLDAIRDIIQFLSPQEDNLARTETTLNMGKFGEAEVSLVWDNEDFVRCFIVVNGESNASIRISLLENDVKMLLDAFRQVADSL